MPAPPSGIATPPRGREGGKHLLRKRKAIRPSGDDLTLVWAATSTTDRDRKHVLCTLMTDLSN